MTYMTSIPINTYRAASRKLLVSRQVAHATVLQAFAPTQKTVIGENRVLWRLDGSGKETALLIVSPEAPSVEHIVEASGWSSAPDGGFQQVSCQPLLDSLSDDGTYHFSLAVNPVNTVTQSNKRVPIKEEDLEEWIGAKLTGAGLKTNALSIDSYDIDTFKRGSSKVTLAIARVHGSGRIDDADALRAAMVGGIGRAKGYGCGLLTIDNKTSD
jgi:CRISPR system Cascade subunit CasE